MLFQFQWHNLCGLKGPAHSAVCVCVCYWVRPGCAPPLPSSPERCLLQQSPKESDECACQAQHSLCSKTQPKQQTLWQQASSGECWMKAEWKPPGEPNNPGKRAVGNNKTPSQTGKIRGRGQTTWCARNHASSDQRAALCHTLCQGIFHAYFTLNGNSSACSRNIIPGQLHLFLLTSMVCGFMTAVSKQSHTARPDRWGHKLSPGTDSCKFGNYTFLHHNSPKSKQIWLGRSTNCTSRWGRSNI